jgi:DNA invertase Pin-like site-specific DNA recombinase
MNPNEPRRLLVGYCRVSTSRQGRSGLGLEAQRKAIENFASTQGYEVLKFFIEVESGKGADALDRRPQLAAALEEARRRRCAVVVSRLDRLSRDVAFISTLMSKRVRFVVTELGEEVEPFVLHIFAAMCERERFAISVRTRDALAAAKSRGITLGGPKLDQARVKAQAAVQAIADKNAANVLPIIDAIKKTGATSLHQIADALNARGVSTPRGGSWHAKSVANLLARSSRGGKR